MILSCSGECHSDIILVEIASVKHEAVIDQAEWKKCK